MSDQDYEQEEGIPDFMTSQKPNQDAIIFMARTDHKQLIATILREMTGYQVVYNEGGNLEFKEGKYHLINLEGAHQLSNFLLLTINPITTLGFYTEEAAAQHTHNITIAISKWLVLHYKKYEIPKAMLQGMIATCRSTIHAQFTKAQDGRENNAVSAPPMIYKYKIDDQRKNKMGFTPISKGEEQ